MPETPNGIGPCEPCGGSGRCAICEGTGAEDMRQTIPDEEWEATIVLTCEGLLRIVPPLAEQHRIRPLAVGALTELRRMLDSLEY